MKIAFLAARPPHPLNAGGRIRTFHLLKEISRVHDVVLLTAVEGQEDQAALVGIREGMSEIAIKAVTVPARNAPGRQMIRMLRSPIDPLPYTWAAYRDRHLIAHMRAALHESNFDLVHCDHIQVAHALFGLKTPPRILNAHNIESVLIGRAAGCGSSPWKRALITWQHLRTLRAEARTHRFFDSSVVVSEVDRAALEKLTPGLSISVVPNGVDIHWFDTANRTIDSKVMVFTGAMDWFPNIDGMTFFVRDVFPLIKRQVPRVKLWIVGRNPSPSLARQLTCEGIHVTGTVSDVRPYMAEAQLVVVPLRVGGGTRLKILEAWAMRRAVLSTSIGAEGLPVTDGENIAVADTPAGLATRATALLNDAGEAVRLGAAGRRVVEEHFSWRRVADSLLEAYEQTVQNGGPPSRLRTLPRLNDVCRDTEGRGNICRLPFPENSQGHR